MLQWRIDLDLGAVLAIHLDKKAAKKAAKEKIARIAENRKVTPETREKIRQAKLGKKRAAFTTEHLARIKQAQLNRRERERAITGNGKSIGTSKKSKIRQRTKS